jgi:hypothetical protein
MTSFSGASGFSVSSFSCGGKVDGGGARYFSDALTTALFVGLAISASGVATIGILILTITISLLVWSECWRQPNNLDFVGSVDDHGNAISDDPPDRQNAIADPDSLASFPGKYECHFSSLKIAS